MAGIVKLGNLSEARGFTASHLYFHKDVSSVGNPSRARLANGFALG